MKFFSKLFSIFKRKSETTVIEGRSPKWPKLRNEFLLSHPRCESCGKKTKLNVHHIKPFHLYPELELDINNLITLCENTGFNCHFVMGHLLYWMAWNPSVVMDTASLKSKIYNRIDSRID